jgi:hypothetical protein
MLLTACAVTTAQTSAPSPFDHAALGQCFDDTDSFIRTTLGKGAAEDPNIIRTSKDAWTWIVDQTASKNYTWYLLQAQQHRLCFRVYVPVASHVEFAKTPGSVRIDAFVAPEADYPAKLVQLSPLPGADSYRALRCYVLAGSTSGRKTKRREVPCEHLFD